MLNDILGMAPWWFWVFVFPELLVFVVYTAGMLLIGLGYVIARPFRAILGRDR